MSALRRTRCGDFTLEEAHTLEQIREDPEGYVLPIERITGKVSMENG